MTSTPDSERGVSRRSFLFGGLGIAAGSVVGWLAAQNLPFRLVSDPTPTSFDPIPPTTYANFARITSTAEEVIIDFCMNPNPFEAGRQELKVSKRLIINFPTAKELFLAMGEILKAIEKEHGLIELDIRKRVKPKP
jgi:hypothetical protein